jgi:phosphatidylinositol-3-phosphatase
LAATVVAALAAALTSTSAPAHAASVPSYDHVFLIVMENHAYNEIIGSSAAPYINSLASRGSLAANYVGIAHPSLPNYLSLIGGSTFGITSDCTTCWISATNIADRLEAGGGTWKAYMESMPSACYIGDSYPYAQKHDPFIYFNDIRTNASRCQSHVVPYSQMSSDLRSTSTTPNYAFITPNMCDDMHDCDVATGDSWLSSQVPVILSSPAFTTQHSLLAITWDEDDFSSANQVPLILLGYGTGYSSGASYNDYSLLSTIEASRGLAPLTGNDAGALPMSDLFNSGVSSSPNPCTSLSLATSPASPSLSGTAITFTASATGCPNPEYEFWRRSAGGDTWALVKGYSSSGTMIWNAPAGSYYVSAWARDASSTTNFDANTTVPYAVKLASCDSATMGASPASPQTSGAQVTFDAVAGGCVDANPLYQFWMRPANSSTWSVVQPYSTNGSFSWDSSLHHGSFYFSVWVKDAASTTASFDAHATSPYTVNPASCSSVTMSRSASGAQVTFFGAAASCSNPNPLYEFWILNGSSWRVVQGWSTNASWTWDTTGLTSGTYHFGVWVRDAASPGVHDGGAMGRYDAYSGDPYSI